MIRASEITGGCNSPIFRDSAFVRCTGVPGIVIGRHSTPSAIQHPGWHARIISRSERPRSLHVGRSDRAAWNAADENSCRHQASGSLFPLLHHSPKSESSFGKRLVHVLSIRVVHAPKEQHGASEWNEKALPNPTIPLVRMT